MTCLEKDQFIPVNVLCFGAKQLSKRRPKPWNRYVSSRYSSAIYETNLLFLLVELPNLHHDFGQESWLDPPTTITPPNKCWFGRCLFTCPNKKTRIFQVPALSFFRGFIRNSWLDSQLKTASLEIPFDRVSLLNKNLEHRHQQNVALMRLGVHLKKSILTKCSSNTMEINKPQGYLHNLNKIWKLFWPRIQFLQQRVLMGNPPTPTICPLRPSFFWGGRCLAILLPLLLSHFGLMGINSHFTTSND